MKSLKNKILVTSIILLLSGCYDPFDLTRNDIISDDVVFDFISKNNCQNIVWFNAIAPLQTLSDIRGFTIELKKNNVDSQFATKREYLQAIFKNQNIDNKTRVLNYCGGGIAATLNAFLLRQLGIEKLEIYDNSMSEWATDHNLPIERS